MLSKSFSLLFHVASSSVICATVIDNCFSCSVTRENAQLSIHVSEKFTNYTNLKRGDLVTIKSPNNPRQKTLNRIVGLEGDIINHDKMTLLDPSDASKDILRFTNARVLPPGKIWVEAQNETNNDSQQFGPIPLGLVMSRVWGKVYPFKEATIYHRNTE